MVSILKGCPFQIHSPILWAPSIYATFAGSAIFAYS
nr:MAG TPA: hypothetical protein [Caudoviricetes sp.]